MSVGVMVMREGVRWVSDGGGKEGLTYVWVERGFQIPCHFH